MQGFVGNQGQASASLSFCWSAAAMEWREVEAILSSPHRTDVDLSGVLEHVQDTLDGGSQVPKHIADIISGLLFGPREQHLADIAVDIARRCRGPGGCGDTPRRKRKRAAADTSHENGLDVMPDVAQLRWGSLASCMVIPQGSAQNSGGRSSAAQIAPCTQPATAPKGRRPAKAARKWIPGSYAGWLGRNRRMQEQAQLLVANCHHNVRRLSSPVQMRIQQELPPVGFKGHTGLAAKTVSSLLGLPAKTVANTVGHVRRSGGGARRPCMRPRASSATTRAAPGTVQSIAAEDVLASAPGEARGLAAQEAQARLPAVAQGAAAQKVPALAAGPAPGFVSLVRVTQFMSTHGLGKTLLPNIVHLITAAKGDVGSSQHTHHFCSIAEQEADDLLTAETMKWLSTPLPGTGRPPDVEVFADGGTCGQYYSRARDKMLVVGVAVSTPFPPYSVSLLVACVNEEDDARAPAEVAHLEKAFDRLGAGTFAEWRRHRFAVAVGDQAMAPGGCANQSQELAMKLLWDGQRSRRDVADLFHLLNRAMTQTLVKNLTAQKLFQLLKKLQGCFQLGQGRHVDRSVAAFWGQQQRCTKSTAGGRKGGYLCGVPERFLAKYENFHYNILVRMNHALEGRGSHTFAWLKELGAEITDQTIVTFALGLVGPLTAHFEPLVLASQRASSLPWERWRKLQEQDCTWQGVITNLGWWRRRIRLLALLEPYFRPRKEKGQGKGEEAKKKKDDVGSLALWWQALCLSPEGRPVCNPRTGMHMMWRVFEMLFHGTFQGCALHAAQAKASAGSHRTVHPTCQCCTRPQAKPGSDFAVYGDDGGSIRADDRVGRLMLRWGLGSSGAGAEQLPKVTARAAWWVCRSVYLRADIRNSAVLEDPDLCLPRYQSYDPAARGPCKPICLAPPRAWLSMQKMDAAMAQLQQLWHQWRVEFASIVVGSVGVSMAFAWEWTRGHGPEICKGVAQACPMS